MLEYDDERSGSFETLREVPADKIAVLGLVTTKSPRRETLEGLIDRLKEASAFLPLDQLALSPQCGFSTSVLGNDLSFEDQRYKLALIARTAGELWA